MFLYIQIAFFHPICRRCSKALLLHYVEYLLLNKSKYTFKCLNIFIWLNTFCRWKSFLFCMCMCECVCVCVCVYVCVSIVFLMIFRQLSCVKFHTKIFATNGSQIWVFTEVFMKYILSLENCNTTCKKWNENYKKKKKILLLTSQNSWKKPYNFCKRHPQTIGRVRNYTWNFQKFLEQLFLNIFRHLVCRTLLIFRRKLESAR